MVLLESGKLFLFDLESCCFHSDGMINNFKGKNLKVSWDDYLGVLEVEFSWHPRILVVAHSIFG